jgi:sugar phosphate isomerase/epimerase
MPTQLTRRNLLAGLAAAAASSAQTRPGDRFTICAFSKHYQWTDVRETAEICARLGFEGLDLTLRAGGHVLPERVEDDLPKAAGIIRQAGLKLAMVTTDIVDTRTPHAESILKTLKALGVRHYRWGNLRYDLNKSIPGQLAEFKLQVKDLAAMNRQYGVCGMYHTHSGRGLVSASFWDLYLLLKGFDPDAVSANFDIGHATVEGGLGGWVHSAKLLTPFIRGVAVKDFAWERNAKGVWQPHWCALGRGMVNFREFLQMLKAARFAGPLQLHMEYDELGGAGEGRTAFSISKEKLLAIMQRDLDTLKGMLREAGMA